MRDRVTVLNVGGAGDIAGGLSQVVEALCSWTFEHVDAVALPTRRRGSVAGTAAALTSAVAAVVRRWPDRDRTVVAVHLSQGGSFVREGALAAIARASGFAVVVHLHGSGFAAFARRRRRLARSVLTRADAILVLTEETAEAVRSIAPTSTVLDVPNAVVIPPPTPKSDLIVFAGTVCRRKGVDVLLDAWSGLDVADDGWTLSLVGPVEMDLEPWQHVQGITVCGAMDHDVLLDMLQRARVVVLPSRAEALPMALLEGMAAGCAAVSTDVGSIARLLRGGAGRVVPPGDTAALREAVNEVLHDRSMLDELAAAARARVEADYSAASVFPRVEAAWTDALGRARGAGRAPNGVL